MSTFSSSNVWFALQDAKVVQIDLFDFLTDEDFPRRGNKCPKSWREAVEALRGEMITHPVIVSAAMLFCIEINIIDWEGVSLSDFWFLKPKINFHNTLTYKLTTNLRIRTTYSWQRQTKIVPVLHNPSSEVNLAYTGSHYILLSKRLEDHKDHKETSTIGISVK